MPENEADKIYNLGAADETAAHDPLLKQAAIDQIPPCLDRANKQYVDAAPTPADPALQEALDQVLNDARPDSDQEWCSGPSSVSGLRPSPPPSATTPNANSNPAYSLTALQSRRVIHREAKAWTALQPKLTIYRESVTAFAAAIDASLKLPE